MTQQELEAVILEHLAGIAALDYSDVSFMDEFIETAHSPHLLVHGVECHIERTRHIDAGWLPVNYVVVSQLDGKDSEYRPTITVDGESVTVQWTEPKRTPALQGYVNAVKAEAIKALTGGVNA
jgi:hypothetical protein